MMGRRLMTPDELKSMPKGQFIVMKTGRRQCCQTAAVPGLGHHIYRAVCIGAACAAGSEVCGEQRVEKEDTERVRYPAGAADCTGAGRFPGGRSRG